LFFRFSCLPGVIRGFSPLIVCYNIVKIFISITGEGVGLIEDVFSGNERETLESIVDNA